MHWSQQLLCMLLEITANRLVASQNLQKRQYLSIDPASLRDEPICFGIKIKPIFFHLIEVFHPSHD